MEVRIKLEDSVADTTVCDRIHFGPHKEAVNETGTLKPAQDIKSELPRQECATGEDTKDIKIKLEAIVPEEVYIKNEEYLDKCELTPIIESTFTCGICNKKLLTKSTLKQHLKLHNGGKPFQCNVCDYKCARKDKLRPHITMHTGEKSFQCCMCGGRFSTRQSLDRHILKCDK